MNREVLVKIWGRLAAFTVLGVYALLVGFLLKEGWQTLGLRLFFDDTPPFDAIFHGALVWEGIWPAFVGSMSLLILTIAMAVVPGVGCGIYLARGADSRFKKVFSIAIDLVAGVPSIVMGLFGFVMIILLKHTVWPGANTCLALSAFCLALLVLPSLVVTTRNALESLPFSLEETGTALGMNDFQILRYILLPAASSGIIGGVILAVGRAVEDTAVIMLTGAVVNAGLPGGLAAKYEALPFLIYYTSAEYSCREELLRGFGTAIVLFAISSVTLLVASHVERIAQKRWKGC